MFMDKETIQLHFNHYYKRIEGLKDKIKEVEKERENFVNENRKEIKCKYLPKIGQIFHVTDELSKLGDIYYYTERKPEVKYIKVRDARLMSKSDFCIWSGSPTVNVDLLDEDFGTINSVYRGVSADLLNNPLQIKSDEHEVTHVYVMIDKNTGLYKIGKSKSPLIREKTLQSEKPTIELIFKWVGYSIDEKKLHNHFHEKRVRGEWFSLNYIDIDYIKNYFKKYESE